MQVKQKSKCCKFTSIQGTCQKCGKKGPFTEEIFNEYYVVYLKGSDTHFKMILAKTSRQALSLFRKEKIRTKKIVKVIEWVNANIQVDHEVVRNEIVTT